MIAADAITTPDDQGRMWWIDEDSLRTGGAIFHDLDRPCDNCEGSGIDHLGQSPWDCPDCHGTGRHVFEIEVECDEPDIRRYEDLGWHYGPTCDRRQCRDGEYTLPVHVVEGMVLPITDVWNVPITPPPTAKPGMYAVQLQQLAS